MIGEIKEMNICELSLDAIKAQVYSKLGLQTLQPTKLKNLDKQLGNQHEWVSQAYIIWLQDQVDHQVGCGTDIPESTIQSWCDRFLNHAFQGQVIWEIVNRWHAIRVNGTPEYRHQLFAAETYLQHCLSRPRPITPPSRCPPEHQAQSFAPEARMQTPSRRQVIPSSVNDRGVHSNTVTMKEDGGFRNLGLEFLDSTDPRARFGDQPKALNTQKAVQGSSTGFCDRKPQFGMVYLTESERKDDAAVQGPYRCYRCETIGKSQ